MNFILSYSLALVRAKEKSQFMIRKMLAIQQHRYTETTQELTLSLPMQFQIPTQLFTVNPDDFANLLFSASKIHDFQKQTAFESLQTEYLQEEIQSKIKEKNQEIESIRKQLEKTIRQKQTEVDEQSVEIEKLRAQVDTIRQTASDLADKRVDDLRQTHENYNSFLKETVNNQLKLITELQTQLQEKTLLTAKSQKKGTQGELFFQDIAHKTIGWNLDVISKTAHTTDLNMNLKGVHALFEIKNYKDAPDHEQYKKFIHDVNLHNEADIAFYIALKTDIPFFEDITIEWTPSHQMLVIVPQFLQHDMPTIFKQFEGYIEISKKIRNLLKKFETNDNDARKIERITTYVQNMGKRIEKAKKEYDVLRKQLQSAVDSMRQHVEGFFEQQCKDLHSTLAILGDEEHEEIPSIGTTDETLELPNLAKEKKRRKAKAKEPKPEE